MPRPAALLGTLALDRAADAPLQRQLYDALREAILARPPGAAHAAAVVAPAGARSRRRAQHDRRRLRATRGRGLPRGARRRWDARRGGAAGGAAARRARGDAAAGRGQGSGACPREGRRSSRCGGRRQIPAAAPSSPVCRRSTSSRASCGRGCWRRRARMPARGLRGYAHPAGLPALREAIAAYLGPARGVACDPAQVVVVSRLAGGARSVLPPAARSGRRGLDRGARLPGRARRADRCGRTAGAGARRRDGHRRRGRGSRAAPPRVWRT